MRLLDSKTCIFFYCFWYNIYFVIIFFNLLKDKMWIIVLQIMKHNRNFLFRLRFRLHYWCANPKYFPVMWSESFTFTSPSLHVLLQIQHLVELLKTSWSFLALARGLLNFVPITSALFHFLLSCHSKMCQ